MKIAERVIFIELMVLAGMYGWWLGGQLIGG